ncbi:amidohydrolase family protein [Devosia beringensis]|uniref:amidohydrolase family protein n=1 Tax=Devosia beringensis TaxID=2657486 RepID=UPI00186BA8B8|nr:amidohydrolase family protein [Devosia beringensis]
MIIDVHGHYTTVMKDVMAWRAMQLNAMNDPANKPKPDFGISDDRIRETLESGQIRLQRERGTDVTIFSPIASAMAHHLGNEAISQEWTRMCNDLIYRAVSMYPKNFIAVCQLPQFPGVSPKNCIAELERCVETMGFVGCNLNPDPSGGNWSGPPLTDRYWYPIYEKMVELDVPAMIHTALSDNPNFHTTGVHYINGDTTAFMQFLQSQLFKDFPTLRFVIPHGGGAVPYHWGRYRGLAIDLKMPPLGEHLLDNIFFDTCVYHQPGVELLAKVIPAKNILFASEMIGAVQAIDPETGHYFDDTKRYLDDVPFLSDDERTLIFEGNARRVYPRLNARLAAVGLS